MTVSELIEQLKTMPQDAKVILQKDAEGNGYRPLDEVDGNCIYIAQTTWAGDVWDTTWSAHDAGYDTEEEWEAVKASNPRCVVLCPVN